MDFRKPAVPSAVPEYACFALVALATAGMSAYSLYGIQRGLTEWRSALLIIAIAVIGCVPILAATLFLRFRRKKALRLLSEYERILAAAPDAP